MGETVTSTFWHNYILKKLAGFKTGLGWPSNSENILLLFNETHPAKENAKNT